MCPCSDGNDITEDFFLLHHGFKAEHRNLLTGLSHYYNHTDITIFQNEVFTQLLLYGDKDLPHYLNRNKIRPLTLAVHSLQVNMALLLFDYLAMFTFFLSIPSLTIFVSDERHSFTSHFSKNIPFYSTTIFSYITKNLSR